MRLLQLLRCVFGKHQRDRRDAQFDGDVFRSKCIGCGKPMIRDVTGWRVAD